MAGLFTLMYLAIVALLLKQRPLAMSLITLALISTVVVFWFHANDTLKINW